MDPDQGHHEYKELFNAIDGDNSGYINIQEMIEYLHAVCGDDVDEGEIRAIFSKIDVTGDRTIDFWEFELYKLPGICRRVFDLCDKDSNGTLSFREARKGCKLLQDRLGITEIEDWLQNTDVDGDHRITFEEFKFSCAGNSLIEMEP